MAIVESIFDIAYLSIVLSLGIRLLLEKSKLAILSRQKHNKCLLIK